MAKLDKSFVLIRFSFGGQNVKGRQRSDNTYRYAVRKLMISYMDGQYEEVRNKLTEGVEKDLQRELVNLASLYRRFIIGANGNTTQPAGVIRSAIGNAAPLALASVLPPWAPRDARYLERKFNARAGSGWFDNRGWRPRPGQTWVPRDAGLLFEKSRADVWQQMFGPISVRFERDNSGDEGKVKFGPQDHATAQLGTLRVYALGNITPDMLPGLAAGEIGTASTAGNPGLMNLVEDYDPRLAYRLGQRSTGTKQYRPTLEPFLSYFLTRSIPAAVAARIGQGSLKRITRSSS